MVFRPFVFIWFLQNLFCKKATDDWNKLEIKMNSVWTIILSTRSINQCKWIKCLSAGLDQVVWASSTVIDKKRKTPHIFIKKRGWRHMRKRQDSVYELKCILYFQSTLGFHNCSKLFSVTVTKGSQTATKPLPSNLQLQLPTAALLELCNYGISKRQQAITTDELIRHSCNCVLF